MTKKVILTFLCILLGIISWYLLRAPTWEHLIFPSNAYKIPVVPLMMAETGNLRAEPVSESDKLDQIGQPYSVQLANEINKRMFNVPVIKPLPDHIADIINATKIPNKSGIPQDTFKVLSYDPITGNIITNLVLLDVNTMDTIVFKTVVLKVNQTTVKQTDGSTGKSDVIERVQLDPNSISTVNEILLNTTLEPLDPSRHNYFRISNPLHLFYPYTTSDTENLLTTVQQSNFDTLAKISNTVQNAMTAAESESGQTTKLTN